MKPMRETRIGRALAELLWGTPVWPLLRKLARGAKSAPQRLDSASRHHDQRQRQTVMDFDAETTRLLARTQDDGRV
jgi:hypothetical protein